MRKFKLRLTIRLYFFLSIFLLNNLFAGDNIWTQIGKNLTTKPIKALAINPLNSNTIYVGAFGDGILKTVNGGNSWDTLKVGITKNAILSITIDPIDTNLIYAGTTEGLFLSGDNGDNWFSVGLENLKIYAIENRMSNSKVVYIGTNNGIYLIENSDSLRFRNIGLEGKLIESLAITKKDSLILYAGTNYGDIFQLQEKSDGWRSISDSLMISNKDTIFSLVVDPNDSKILYAGTNHGIYKSLNKGLNWRKFPDLNIKNQTVKKIAIDPMNSDMLLAGTEKAGIFRSRDSGITWSTVNVGLNSYSICSLIFDPKLPCTSFAGTENGCVFNLSIKKEFAPIMIFNFNTRDFPDEEGERISRRLASKIDSALQITIVKEDTSHIIVKQDIPQDTIKLCKMLGVLKAITGNVSLFEDQLYINTQIKDIEEKNTVEIQMNFPVNCNYYPSMIDSLARLIVTQIEPQPNGIKTMKKNIWNKIYNCIKSKCFLIGSCSAVTIIILINLICDSGDDKKYNRLPDPPKFP